MRAARWRITHRDGRRTAPEVARITHRRCARSLAPRAVGRLSAVVARITHRRCA